MVARVLPRQLGRHPLAPVQREPPLLKRVERADRRGGGEAGRVGRRLLEEEHLVALGQGRVEVAADVREADGDPGLGEDEEQHEAKVELRPVGVLKVGRRQSSKQVEALSQRQIHVVRAATSRRTGRAADDATAAGGRRTRRAADATAAAGRRCAPNRGSHRMAPERAVMMHDGRRW